MTGVVPGLSRLGRQRMHTEFRRGYLLKHPVEIREENEITLTWIVTFFALYSAVFIF
jgi:hypothetical protein